MFTRRQDRDAVGVEGEGNGEDAIIVYGDLSVKLRLIIPSILLAFSTAARTALAASPTSNRH